MKILKYPYNIRLILVNMKFLLNIRIIKNYNTKIFTLTHNKIEENYNCVIV